ncbi:MAG TPA: hypothetical protein VLE89_08575 [Chlamydiales bacterium]|nr:hypothetical protein [Chlamydiales bacterium]
MLIFAFILATVAVILQGILQPFLPILAYAPFLALATLRAPLVRALWMSAAAGAVMDLLSDHPFGLHALNYAITTAILYRIRNRFSYDQSLHFSFFSALVSAISTLLHLILLFLFDRRVPFSGKWFFIDWGGIVAIDALYAFVWFAAPIALFERLHRLWGIYWLKRKNPSLTSQ